MRYLAFLCSILTAVLWIGSAEAPYTIRQGSLMHVDYLPTMEPEGHYKAGLKAYSNNDWEEVIRQFNILIVNFPDHQCTKECYIYLGVAYFYESELEDANEAFSSYIKALNHPVYFQEALCYKLEIANLFAGGAKRRILGWKSMPKLLPAHDFAQQIYDEIIATFPCHELSAQSLYSKGVLHWKDKEFRESIEAFQQLIRRFPKHELAPECYTLINKVYLEQSQYEYQNPDLLALADLNHKKFAQDFPGEERVGEAERDVQNIREVYAFGLFDTAKFYERIKKPSAAIIYYKNAIKQFPETQIANRCRFRLSSLGVGFEEIAQAPSE